MLPPGNRKSKIRPPRRSLLSNSNGLSGDGEFEYDKTWNVINGAISQIQSKNVSNLSYEQLYRKAYIIVLKKRGGRLYNDVTKQIVEHLLNVRLKLISEFNMSVEFDEAVSARFIKAVLHVWEEHMQSMKFVSDILMYLNRVYVKENKLMLIYDLGLNLFKDNVIKFNNNEIGHKLIEVVVNEITKTRYGNSSASKVHITKLIGMFEQLQENIELGTETKIGDNYYLRYFEPQFLAISETTFYDLADKFLEGLNGSSYIQNVQVFLKDEENRINFYLPQSTFPKVTTLMNNILIKDKIDTILTLPVEQSGFKRWLQPILDNVFDSGTKHMYTYELKILYDLIERLDSDFSLLKLRTKEVILAHGKLIPLRVQDFISRKTQQNKAQTKKSNSDSALFATAWIEAVLKYHKLFEEVFDESFHKSSSMKLCITQAIKEFINPQTHNPRKLDKSTVNAPEVLSIFIDHQIKQLTKSSGTLTKVLYDENDSVDDQAQDLVSKSVLFLTFIKDKDAFEAHYANHFAKRFLNSKSGTGSSASTAGGRNAKDLEELLLSKICEELGSTSMEKVVKMNIDVRSSKDLTSEWKKYVKESNISSGMEMELKICNLSFWPKSMTRDYQAFSPDINSNNYRFIWPKALRKNIRLFEDFWISVKKNENKSLFWCPKFGSMELRITYPSRTYDISLHTFAAIIILLFAPQCTNLDGSLPSAFAEQRELTYEEIRELTGIPEADLKRQLQSIAVAPRSRLLCKVPMSKEINSGDVFKLNANFKSPSSKVKVLTVSANSSNSSNTNSSSGSNSLPSKDSLVQDERIEVETAISEGRKREVDAAIVRIMKSSKTIKHNELVELLVQQLYHRFMCTSILIKQRIEDLMEKEYLKRDDKDRSIYHYIS